MPLSITTLDNGLTVISDPMPNIPSVSFTIGVDVGSRYEKVEENGISHFLEHMAFKGTSRRTARQIAEEFDTIGGYLNASTDREHTLYYAKVLKENVPLAIDLMADILQHSTFDKEELERERMVILQEIAQANDTPDDIVFDYFQETAFQNMALGRPVLGREETIQTFTQEHFHAFTETHHQPSRMVVAAAGNIEHDELVSRIAEAFSSLKKGTPIYKEPAHYTGGECIIERDLEQVQLVMGLPGISYMKPEFYHLQVLSTILGGGMSSRLFQEVREKRGLAYTIQSFTSSYADTGIFGIYAGTSEEHLPLLLNVLKEEMHKLAEDVHREEIDRARAQLKAAVLMGQESSSFRAEEAVRNYLVFKRPILVEELISKIEAVQKEDILHAMQKLLSIPPTITALGPVKGLSLQAGS